MSDELVTIASFSFAVDAEMARIRLEQNGIESVILNEILARLSRWNEGVILQVREDDAKQALEILKSE